MAAFPVVMEELLARSTDKSALIEVLKTTHRESCPTTYNFHLHTQHSDGQCLPVDLLEQAIRIGLKGLAITDHHSVDGFWVATQWLEQSELSLEAIPQIWTGVEITSRLLGDSVHILALAYEPLADAMQPYLTGESVQGPEADAAVVIEAIHQAHGLAILAHPVRYKTAPELLIEAAVELGLDGVEAFYCYGSDHPWVPSDPQTALVSSLGDRFQLLKSCGTDTHGLDIMRRR